MFKIAYLDEVIQTVLCASLPYPNLAVLQTRIKALRVSIEPPETETRRVAALPNKHMEGISRRSVLTPGRRAGGLVRCADGATCGELRVSELLPLMPVALLGVG